MVAPVMAMRLRTRRAPVVPPRCRPRGGLGRGCQARRHPPREGCRVLVIRVTRTRHDGWTMAHVEMPTGLVRHTRALAQRVAAAPDWPVGAAVVLTLLGLAEAVLRPQHLRDNPSTALVFSLCATAPLVLVRSHAVVTGVLVSGIAGASLFTIRGAYPLTTASVVALLVAVYQ